MVLMTLDLQLIQHQGSLSVVDYCHLSTAVVISPVLQHCFHSLLTNDKLTDKCLTTFLNEPLKYPVITSLSDHIYNTLPQFYPDSFPGLKRSSLA